MRSRLARLRGLVHRYRVDRRLPPQVFALYRTVLALRLRTLIVTTARGLRRPPMSRSGVVPTVSFADQGASRVRSAGALDVPLSALTHRFAERVVHSLQAWTLDPFVVDRRADSVVIGIDVAQRTNALRALVAELREPGWYLDWSDGHRTGTVAVGSALGRRSVEHAREWRVYQVHSWGDRSIGQEQATVVTFWDLGTSGQLELVGTRGHERFDARSPSTVEVIEGRRYPGRTAFPIGSSLQHLNAPVDLVYTWVDGSDLDWQRHFSDTALQFGREVGEVALDPARYRSRDELRYSLRSVWAFCGWVRRIHIVTAGQVPAWLTTDDRVRIVDHSEILPADALPTFNSHAMESSLHRIDGLAEHFVYFNDDMLVGRSIRPETFFTPNGLARVFQSGARVPGVEDERTLAVDTAARRGRELLDERFGRVVVDKPLHSPYPLRRSVMEEIELQFPEIVERTAHSRFRSPTDLSIAASFAQHYALATGKAVLGDIATEYVHVESGRLAWHLDRIRLGRDLDTFCINETSDMGGDVERREQMIADFFEEYFPVPAPWENDRGRGAT